MPSPDPTRDPDLGFPAAHAVRGLASRVPPLAWIVSAGLLLWLAIPHAYPWYDTSFALASAQDLLAGRTVGYAMPGSPALHPITSVAAMAAVPFGSLADELLIALTLFAFGALCWSVFQLGSRLFSWQVGLLAALIVYTSVAMESFAVRAYGDIGFAALVAYAAAGEVRRPRRGWPVLILLAAAGLLRPQAWLFAAAYVAYVFPRRSWIERLGLAFLVAAAPALWLAGDMVLVGGGFSSVSAATGGHASLDLGRALVDVPVDTPGYLASMTRKVVVAGAAVGLVFAWFNARREALFLISIAALGTLALMVLRGAGQEIVARYAIVPAVIAAIFCSLAVFGWLKVAPGGGRRLWMWAGFAVLALLVLTAPKPVGHWLDTRRDIEANGRALGDLRHLVTSPQARVYIERCKPILVPSDNPVSYLRYTLDSPVGSVTWPLKERLATGLAVVPRDIPGAEGLLRTYAGDLRTYNYARPAGTRTVDSNSAWILYAGEGCTPGG